MSAHKGPMVPPGFHLVPETRAGMLLAHDHPMPCLLTVCVFLSGGARGGP